MIGYGFQTLQSQMVPTGTTLVTDTGVPLDSTEMAALGSAQQSIIDRFTAQQTALNNLAMAQAAAAANAAAAPTGVNTAPPPGFAVQAVPQGPTPVSSNWTAFWIIGGCAAVAVIAGALHHSRKS